MKTSRFTDAQKAFILKQGEEGTSIAALCRKVGISQSTYFNWRKKYSWLIPVEAQRLRNLQEETLRIQEAVSSAQLDLAMSGDPSARRS